MMLNVGQRLLEYCAMDVVLVAIDFGNSYAICDVPYQRERGRIYSQDKGLHNCQAGIAILDTRHLCLSLRDSHAVSTQHFSTGHIWYSDTVSKKLLFCASEHVKSTQDLRPKLTELLRFTSAEGDLRPIVIVGCDMSPNSNIGDIACILRLTDPRVVSQFWNNFSSQFLKEYANSIGSQRSSIIDHLDVSDRRAIQWEKFTKENGKIRRQVCESELISCRRLFLSTVSWAVALFLDLICSRYSSLLPKRDT